MTSEEIHHYLLSATDRKFPLLHNIISLNGPVKLPAKADNGLFLHLVHTIVNQQLSTQAAATIWQRLLDACGKQKMTLFDYCHAGNTESIRQCGISHKKIIAIYRLRKAFEDNEISEQQLKNADYTTIAETITKLWGFGKWSADMIAIFFYGLPDIWSPEDAILCKGIKYVSGDRVSVAQKIVVATTPYKSYLSLHLWKAKKLMS